MQHLEKLFDFSFWKSCLAQHPFKGTLALLGLAVTAQKLLGCVHTAYKHFLRPAHNLQERYGNCWALISDVSDAVGAAYAHILGKKFNLLILHDNAHHVEQEFLDNVQRAGKQVVCMAIDYHEGYGGESFKNIREFLSDKDLGIVIINQLNLASEHQAEIPHFQQAITFPVLLTRCLIPMMLKRAKKSAVLGLSHQFIACNSLGGLFELSAKAFLEGYLRSLGAEYRGKIDAVHFEVGSIVEIKREGTYRLLEIPAMLAVKSQLAEIGYEKKGAGHWKHYIEKLLTKH